MELALEVVEVVVEVVFVVVVVVVVEVDVEIVVGPVGTYHLHMRRIPGAYGLKSHRDPRWFSSIVFHWKITYHGLPIP